MRSLAVILAVLLVLGSLASAGNVVKQSINMAGSGQGSQSAANAAVVSGNNNYITQGVSQTARGSQITQSGANAVVVVGNNNRVSQGVSQQASGSQITQSGSNALAVLGNNNYANQQVSERAYGQNIFQNGWNTGSITGNNNVLIQGMLAYARTYANMTNQTLGNTAYVTGSYNQVNQQASAIVVAGRSNAPVTQTGSNFGQSIDKNHNHYDQNTNFNARAGPDANVMQYGTNEVRIGPA